MSFERNKEVVKMEGLSNNSDKVNMDKHELLTFLKGNREILKTDGAQVA